MYLPALSDREIITYAYQTDRLATSELESQLAERLETALESQPIVDAAEKYDLDRDDIVSLSEALIGDVQITVALLDALVAAGIDDTSDLKQKLERADAFYDLVDSDGGDTFCALRALVNDDDATGLLTAIAGLRMPAPRDTITNLANLAANTL